MKICILGLVMSLAIPALAQETTMNLAAPANQMKSSSSIDDLFEEQTLPEWRFNMGLSQFSRVPQGEDEQSGRGLTIEVQRHYDSIYYLGASYTDYKTETSNDLLGRPSQDRIPAVTLSGEARMIQVPTSMHSDIFGAIDLGLMNIEGRSDIYYGIGLGYNFNHQIGFRADVRSSAELRSSNTFSVIGYY